ncbi:hypothetical protein HK102_006082 [Quaeritorhiza haematococci]|nr:hypothetical protein HK102_006082 [Quaeritorhiza haematococci]
MDEKSSLLGGYTPPGRSRKQEKNSSNALKLGFGLILLAVAGAISFGQLANSPLAIQMKLWSMKMNDYLNVYYDPGYKCSGHGVVLDDGKCFCDLGYAGAQCVDVVSTNLAEPVPNTVCIVAETFGPLNPEHNPSGDSAASLAETLAANGYEVTVLYIGTENPQFRTVAQDFRSRRVSLISLPQTGLPFGTNPVEQRSYEVYQYLIRREQFAFVYFDAADGAGYYTLLAQSQGLVCSQTKFILGVDKLPKGTVEMLESADPDHLVTDTDTLKLDYVHQKTVELADTVVTSSKLMLEHMRENNWMLSESSAFIVNPIPSLPMKAKNSKYVTVKEFVFVGPLNLINGLKAFCDAIDMLAKDISNSQVKVTFLGASTLINEMTSEEYIELRSLNWDAFDVQWSIVLANDMFSIMEYLTAPESGRIAVFPSLFDGSAVLSQEVLYAGVPLLGSTGSALRDLIVEEDKNAVLINVNGIELTKKMRELINNRAVVPRSIAQTASASWLDLLGQLADEQSTCNNRFETTDDLPMVSVVIVHHNRHRLLQQAIESIEAQTYKNFEVIVVDDGSTDPEAIQYLNDLSWTWWEEKGWKVIREPNRYLGAARNTGVKHAIGNYIVFLDDDDLAKPHQLETFVKVAINTGANVITSGHDVFGGLEKPTAAKTSKRYLPLGDAKLVGMLENVFGDSKMMVEKNFFITIGGFTEDYGVGFEDYEFLAKTVLKGHHLEAVSEPLNWYRRHEHTMSYETNLKSNQIRMLRAYVEMHPSAPKLQQSLLHFTQRLFFEKHGVFAFERDLNVTTTVLPTFTQTQTVTASTSAASSAYFFSTSDETPTPTGTYGSFSFNPSETVTAPFTGTETGPVFPTGPITETSGSGSGSQTSYEPPFPTATDSQSYGSVGSSTYEPFTPTTGTYVPPFPSGPSSYGSFNPTETGTAYTPPFPTSYEPPFSTGSGSTETNTETGTNTGLPPFPTSYGSQTYEPTSSNSEPTVGSSTYEPFVPTTGASFSPVFPTGSVTETDTIPTGTIPTGIIPTGTETETGGGSFTPGPTESMVSTGSYYPTGTESTGTGGYGTDTGAPTGTVTPTGASGTYTGPFDSVTETGATGTGGTEPTMTGTETVVTETPEYTVSYISGSTIIITRTRTTSRRTTTTSPRSTTTTRSGSFSITYVNTQITTPTEVATATTEVYGSSSAPVDYTGTMTTEIRTATETTATDTSPTATPTPCKKEIDACGVCGGDGTTCFAVQSIEGAAIPNIEGTEITIVGAGFTEDIVVRFDDIELSPDQYTVQSPQFMKVRVPKIDNIPTEQPFLRSDITIYLSQEVDGEAQEAVTYLTVFDESVKVLSVSPKDRRVYAGPANQTIIVKGQNFPVLTEPIEGIAPVCVYNISRTFMRERATIIDDTTIECTYPATTLADTYIAVYVMFYTPQRSVPDYARTDNRRFQHFVRFDAPAILNVWALAPALQSAAFASNGASVVVTLSRPAQMINATLFEQGVTQAVDTSREMGCGFMFETNSTLPNVGLLARDVNAFLTSDCSARMLTPTRIRLTFSALFANLFPTVVRPGQLLKVRDFTFTGLGKPFSDTTTGTVNVTAPVGEVLLPDVSVLAPNVVGRCRLSIDTSRISGSAGRSWAGVAISYTAQPALTAEEDTKLVQRLSQLAETFRTAGGSSMILADEFLPVPAGQSRTYKIAFTMTNFLGGSSSQSIEVLKLDANDVPIVLLSSNRGSRNVPVNSQLILSARASIDPECPPPADAGAVQYNWTTTGSLRIDRPLSPNLIIPPYSVEPKSENEFEVYAGYAGKNQYRFPFKFNTAIDTITANAGSSRTVGSANPRFIMSANILSDGYSPANLNRSIFSCEWHCWNDDTDDVCTLNDEEVDLSGITGCELDMKDKLDVDFTYRFDVTVTNTKTGAVGEGDYAYIVLIDGIVPDIALFVQDLKPSSYSTEFYIEASVDEDTLSDPDVELSYSWTSQDNCDDVDYDSIEFNEDNLLTDPEDYVLKFNPGALVPESWYCFRIEVTDPGNEKNKGVATIVVPVRSAPSAGYCQLDNTGPLRSFDTLISISCQNWVTDPLSYPLFYQFEMREYSEDPDEGWILRQAAGQSSTFDTVSPVGKWQIYVTIIDAAGSINDGDVMIDFDVTGAAPQRLVRRDDTELQKALNYLSTSETTYKQTSDVDTALSDLGIGVAALPNTIATSTEIALQAKIFQYMNDLVASGNLYMDPSGAFVQMISLIGGAIGTGYNMGMDLIHTSVFPLMNQATTEVNANGVDLDTCFSTKSATTYIRVVDTMLGSLASKGNYSTVMASQFQGMMKTMSQCLFRTQTCGQRPLTLRTTYIRQDLALINPATAKSSMCYFSMPNLSRNIPGYKSGCIRYTCGRRPTNVLFNNTGDYVSLAPTTAELTLYDTQNKVIQPNYSTPSIEFTVTVDAAYMARNNFTTWTVGGSNPYAQHNLQPVCVYFLETDPNNPQTVDGKFTNATCSVTAISGNNVTCLCGHLTTFVIGAGNRTPDQEQPTTTVTGPPTAPPTGSTSPTNQPGGGGGGAPVGAIAGAVIGVAVVGAAVAGGVYGMKRAKKRREQQQKQVGQQQPQSTEGAAAQPVAQDQLQRDLSNVQAGADESPVDAAVIVPIDIPPQPVPIRRRDPAALPVYQLPPTYAEHMRSKGLDENNQPLPEQPADEQERAERVNAMLSEENQPVDAVAIDMSGLDEPIADGQVEATEIQHQELDATDAQYTELPADEQQPADFEQQLEVQQESGEAQPEEIRYGTEEEIDGAQPEEVQQSVDGEQVLGEITDNQPAEFDGEQQVMNEVSADEVQPEAFAEEQPVEGAQTEEVQQEYIATEEQPAEVAQTEEVQQEYIPTEEQPAEVARTEEVQQEYIPTEEQPAEFDASAEQQEYIPSAEEVQMPEGEVPQEETQPAEEYAEVNYDAQPTEVQREGELAQEEFTGDHTEPESAEIPQDEYVQSAGGDDQQQ